MAALSIASETFGKVAHPPPRLSRETDRKNNKKGLMIFIVYSNGFCPKREPLFVRFRSTVFVLIDRQGGGGPRHRHPRHIGGR